MHKSFLPVGNIWSENPRAQLVRAVELGRALCDCSYPYHVAWPILRAAEIAGSLRYREEETLAPFLAPLLSSGTRVLIAGSADTGTLCVVGRIAAPHRPDFTVVDRCPAPLELIGEFVAERGISCRTLCADLTRLDTTNRWDVVLVNYTLQFIAPAMRRIVLENLARALAPGGTLVCVAKTAASLSADKAADLEKAWFDAARRKLAAADIAIPLGAAELDALLRQAAAGRTQRRLTDPNAADLVADLRRAGFGPGRQTMTPRRRLLETGGAPQSDVEASVVLVAERIG